MSTAVASAFSSSETAALERQTELDALETAVTYEQIWDETHKKICSGWIRQNGYKRICLQLPDEYLPHSTSISDSLKAAITPVGVTTDAKVFILADTTYGSCCVDEIAAAHVEGDCIVHFGNACRSKSIRLPVLYLYPRLTLPLEEMLSELGTLQKTCANREVCIYLDNGYQHLLEQKSCSTADESEGELYNKFQEVLCAKELHIEAYPPPEDTKNEYEPGEDTICIFVGTDNHRFATLSLTTKAAQWYIYEPATHKLSEKNPLTANYIRRRYYYIEKCKDAQMLGLVVATLTADAYLEVITRLQQMANCRGIKTQLISVGRINPAKLANFMEIDCFVLIGCPFNNMYNSKEYYKPIVSVFEAEMALNPAWHLKYPETYVTDFKQLLPEGRSFLAFNANDVSNDDNDVSLISGRMRGNAASNTMAEEATTSTVATQAKMSLMTTDTGLTFEDRTWQGLDPSLGMQEPAKLQKGLSGIPIKYSHD